MPKGRKNGCQSECSGIWIRRDGGIGEVEANTGEEYCYINGGDLSDFAPGIGAHNMEPMVSNHIKGATRLV